MLEATQKTKDLKYMKLRICLGLCGSGATDYSNYRLGKRGIVVPFPEGAKPFSTQNPARG
jgi:hypothetical protein